MNFNPRSPCGERQAQLQKVTEELGISIHAPRVGSDMVVYCVAVKFADFNPRSPCGERLT